MYRHDLGWKFLMKDTNQLKIYINNFGKPFGRFVVSGLKLLSLPRDLMGICDVQQEVSYLTLLF